MQRPMIVILALVALAFAPAHATSPHLRRGVYVSEEGPRQLQSTCGNGVGCPPCQVCRDFGGFMGCYSPDVPCVNGQVPPPASEQQQQPQHQPRSGP